MTCRRNRLPRNSHDSNRDGFPPQRPQPPTRELARPAMASTHSGRKNAPARPRFGRQQCCRSVASLCAACLAPQPGPARAQAIPVESLGANDFAAGLARKVARKDHGVALENFNALTARIKSERLLVRLIGIGIKLELAFGAAGDGYNTDGAAESATDP